MTRSDPLRAAGALLSVCGAYFLAFLVYAIFGGDAETLSKGAFLVIAAVLWMLVGAAFDRPWVAAVPLVPYLGFELSIALSGTAVHYGEHALTLELLLAVSVVALAIGFAFRRIAERLL